MEKQVVHRYRSYNYLFKVCLNICLTSFMFGFGNSNFNAVAFDDVIQIYELQQYPRATTQGLLTGCLSIMGGIGAFCSSYLLKKLTRRQSIQFLAWMSLISGVVLCFPSLEFLVVGRLMQGLCIGMCSTVAPLYLRQFSPLQIASSLCPYNQIFIVFGIASSFTLAFFFSLFLPAHVYWRFVFGFPIVTSCIQLYNIKFNFPYETPKYLILSERYDEAKVLLNVIYEPRYVNKVFRQIKQAIASAAGRETIESSCYSLSSREIGISMQQLQQITEERRQHLLQQEQEMVEIADDESSMKEQIETPNNKLAVFLSFYLSIQQQMVGMGSIIAYSGEIVGSIMPAFGKVFPIFINVFALVGCFGAIPVVRWLGRKKNLEYGALSISLVLILLSYTLSNYDFTDPTQNPHSQSYLVMFLFISIRMLYSLSTGPIVFLFLSETVQADILALSTMVSWFTVAGLNIIFPILTDLAGGNPAPVYLFFGIYTFIGFIVNKKLLIETAGKTEYQIRKEFDEKWK